MPSKYKRLIGDYRARHGIAVPPGFGRNAPYRYVIIRTRPAPPKLLAVTGFKAADVRYYIEHFFQPELGGILPKSIRILELSRG